MVDKPSNNEYFEEFPLETGEGVIQKKNSKEQHMPT